MRGEEVEAVEAERPELARGGRGGGEGAEKESSGLAAGGADGEVVGGRRLEARDEGVDLRGRRGGEAGARVEEKLGPARRRITANCRACRGGWRGALLAVEVGRRRAPVRREEGPAVLRRTHGVGVRSEGFGGFRRWLESMSRGEPWVAGVGAVALPGDGARYWFWTSGSNSSTPRLLRFVLP